MPVLLAALGVLGAAWAGDGREAPRPTKLSWIEASIQAVHENGVAERLARKYGEARADGSRALPLKHVVQCESESACIRVARWASREGLRPSEPRTEFSHGSIPYYEIDLKQMLPLEVERIRAEALRIHEALEPLRGTRYATWMLDLDPEGTRDAR